MVKLKNLLMFIFFFVCTFSFVHGQATTVFVKGTVIDAGTKNPVEKAMVIISSGFGANVTPIDTLTTDKAGKVADVMTINTAVIGIAYTVIANGYTTKSSYCSIAKDSLDLGTISLTAIQIKTIAISGVVIDSSSGSALKGATVSIRTMDTTIAVLTNASGVFVTDFKYNTASVTQCNYTVDMWGYDAKNGTAKMTGADINLDTIALRSVKFDTLVVKAQTYFANSKKPVEGAVLLSYVTTEVVVGAFNYTNTQIQSLKSGVDGKIQGSIIYELGGGFQTMKTLMYALTYEKIDSVEGSKLVNRDTLDLGTLYIDEQVALLKTNELKYQNVSYDQVQVYTINGRMIFEGNVFDRNQIKDLGIALNQPLLLVKKFNGKTVLISKMLINK